MDIVYEDEQVLCEQAGGMLSQKAEKEDVSLVEYLTRISAGDGKPCKEICGLSVLVCNRLDRNTSGLRRPKTIQGLQGIVPVFSGEKYAQILSDSGKGEIRGSSPY